MIIAIPLTRDSANSDCSKESVRFSTYRVGEQDYFVEIALSNPDRVISIKATDFRKMSPLF
jgi:hypothetical protein